MKRSMKDEFEELYNFIRLDDELSPWGRETTFTERIEELQKEIQEMKVELEKSDYEEFRKEVGDVLWDLLCLIAKAEHQKLLSLDKLLPEIHEKFKRRKLFLQERRKVTKEEEIRIWQEVKVREKNERN